MRYLGHARLRTWFAGLVVVLVSLAFAPGAMADDPDVQFASIPAQQNGNTLANQTIVTFWSSRNAAPTPTATINWGDGTGNQPATVTANGCKPAPDGDTNCISSSPGGYQYVISAGHTFQGNGPYQTTVTMSGTAGEAFTLQSQTTIPSCSSGLLGFAQLKLLGPGCIAATNTGTKQITPAGVPVLVNGLELHPAPGVSLTLDSSSGTLSSGTGNVGLVLGEAALHQHQTSFKPKPINWRVVPNPGEQSIDEGSTGRFQVNIGGLLLNLPTLSLNNVKLTNGQSDTNFTVGLPIPTIAKFFGEVKATATILSDNPGGARFDGLDAQIGASQKPETKGVKVAAPFKAFSGHLKFRLAANTWDVSLLFTVPGAGGVSASVQIVNGKPTEVRFSANYNTPGLAIGDTGAFLQSISGGFAHYPHYSRPKIGLVSLTNVRSTDDARRAECADIDAHYDQYIALNKLFPSYCGKVGEISFDPPLEVDGNVGISAGPSIAGNSALTVNGGFRYVDSYFDGSNNVPWAFNVNGSVTLIGLPFNRSTIQVYPTGNFQNKTNFAPINNSGTKGFVEIHGDGLVEAGGGFDYTFPQSSSNWIFQVNGEAVVSLIPKGAAIGSPAPGSTAQQYANVVKGHAAHWTVAGTITGKICAQIPKVASGCATGAAGISNNGVAGCASFSLPGTKVVQAIAIGFARTVNFFARTGAAAPAFFNNVFTTFGNFASHAASQTGHFFQNVGSHIASTGSTVVNTVGSGLSSAGHAVAHFFGFAGDRPSAGVASPFANSSANEVINENIVIPDINYSIGAAYRWSDKSTHPITSCSHDALLQALASHDLARAAAAGGVPSAQVIVHGKTAAPRLFEIKGVTAAPDVLVMGPDHRAIRTMGNGFIEPGWVVYKDRSAKITYVDVVAAPPGAWDFIAAPGTSRIANIETARGEPIATVTAGITGVRGRAYVLTYKVFGLVRGESVTLVETDGSGAVFTIARLRHSHGTVLYRPSTKLPSATRIILAVVKRGGTQVSDQPVTGINLKKIAKPGRPHKIRRH